MLFEINGVQFINNGGDFKFFQKRQKYKFNCMKAFTSWPAWYNFFQHHPPPAPSRSRNRKKVG